MRQVERWGGVFIPAYLLASVVAWWRGGDYYLDNWFEMRCPPSVWRGREERSAGATGRSMTKDPQSRTFGRDQNPYLSRRLDSRAVRVELEGRPGGRASRCLSTRESDQGNRVGQPGPRDHLGFPPRRGRCFSWLLDRARSRRRHRSVDPIASLHAHGPLARAPRLRFTRHLQPQHRPPGRPADLARLGPLDHGRHGFPRLPYRWRGRFFCPSRILTLGPCYWRRGFFAFAVVMYVLLSRPSGAVFTREYREAVARTRGMRF